MRSTDASEPDEDSRADLSETFLLPMDDSEASLSPAHTTILTVRRASAPAGLMQPIEDANATITICSQVQEEGQEEEEDNPDKADIANETVTLESDYRQLQ